MLVLVKKQVFQLIKPVFLVITSKTKSSGKRNHHSCLKRIRGCSNVCLCVSQYLVPMVTYYLIPSALVDRHVPFQLGAVSEAVATLRAAEAFLSLLVSVLDVLLQRAVALVAA